MLAVDGATWSGSSLIYMEKDWIDLYRGLAYQALIVTSSVLMACYESSHMWCEIKIKWCITGLASVIMQEANSSHL